MSTGLSIPARRRICKAPMNSSSFALSSVLLLFASVTAAAQVRSPSASAKGVPVFKGNGLDQVARGKKPPPPPPPEGLTPSALADISKVLGKVEPGSTYVTLSPSHPAVLNKGALLFWDANLVETGENYAFWGEKEVKAGAPGSVDLWIWSPASRRYAIDCKLSGYQWGNATPGQQHQAGVSFKVIGPDGDAQTFDFSDKNVSGPESTSAFDLFKRENTEAPLTFVLMAGTKGWYGFQIIPQGTIAYLAGGGGSKVAQWAFFSCNVLNSTANVPGQLTPKQISK